MVECLQSYGIRTPGRAVLPSTLLLRLLVPAGVFSMAGQCMSLLLKYPLLSIIVTGDVGCGALRCCLQAG